MIAAAPGPSLFDYADRLDVRVPTSCQKNGKCRECIVEIVEGMELLSPPTPPEKHLTGRFRLSCQAHVAAASGEVKCHTMRRGRMRVETGAHGLPVGLPQALPALGTDGIARVQLDPAVTRDGNRILIDGAEIANCGGPIHGLAADLGTTTIVLRLFDLETGAMIAETSFENPQRFGGSDVMARISYDTEHHGRLLMRTLAGYLSHAIAEFPVDPRTIYEMVVVGNSTMRDLFFRQSVYTIGQNPYRSITEIERDAGKRASTSLVTTGVRSLLPIHPQARVYGAPIISGHVGADAAACMLAVDIAHEDRTIAVMDLGTNTELILGNRDRIVAASCPAGPAFEGGAITCGMPALDGAIEDVVLDDVGHFQFGVIGDVAPEGISGSGLIDLLSELLRHGWMNELGRLDDRDSVTLDAAHGIVFNESDVNELAQAKGANAAGLQVAASHYGIDFADIDMFYLAGGFGRHVKIDAARRIGLIPNMDPAKIAQVGNASIEGACIALLSKSKRDELESLVGRVEHCRLETHPNFFNFFVEGCQFKPLESAVSA